MSLQIWWGDQPVVNPRIWTRFTNRLLYRLDTMPNLDEAEYVRVSYMTYDELRAGGFEEVRWRRHRALIYQDRPRVYILRKEHSYNAGQARVIWRRNLHRPFTQLDLWNPIPGEEAR